MSTIALLSNRHTALSRRNVPECQRNEWWTCRASSLLTARSLPRPRCRRATTVDAGTFVNRVAPAAARTPLSNAIPADDNRYIYMKQWCWWCCCWYRLKEFLSWCFCHRKAIFTSMYNNMIHLRQSWKRMLIINIKKLVKTLPRCQPLYEPTKMNQVWSMKIEP